jgi:cysteinyl-tRNA synthetase
MFNAILSRCGVKSGKESVPMGCFDWLKATFQSAFLLGFLHIGVSFGLDPRFENVNDWLYVLQHPEDAMPEDLASTDFDLVVMDYSAEGTVDTEFSKSQIEAIQATGKVVLCYFSIGEAESQRFYWDDAWTNGTILTPQAPNWLGPSNPNYPNNFKVRYWDPAWQAILFGTPDGPSKSYLDRILDQGFDGIYLDIIDAFEFWSDEIPERSREQARQDMVALVNSLAEYARGTRGATDFLVFPQNGPALIVNDDEELDLLGTQFLAIVDGIGAEDTFYDEINPQPSEEVDYVTSLLDQFRSGANNTRLVLAVDYVWDTNNPSSQSNIQRYNDFVQKCLARSYTPYAAIRDRELQSILTVAPAGGILIPQPRPNAEPVTPTVTETPRSTDTPTPSQTPPSSPSPSPVPTALNPLADVNRDGEIGVLDLLELLRNWGHRVELAR